MGSSIHKVEKPTCRQFIDLNDHSVSVKLRYIEAKNCKLKSVDDIEQSTIIFQGHTNWKNSTIYQ